MSYKTTGIVYASKNFQVMSYGHGAAYDIWQLTDHELSAFVQGDSARDLATELDAFEQQAGSDDRFTADVDAYLSQYFADEI